MADHPSRRSFLVDILNKGAGLWIVATGGSALSTLSGCSSSSGGAAPVPGQDAASGDLSAPLDQGGTQDLSEAKDGSTPLDAADGQQTDVGPVAKYGGPPDVPDIHVEDVGPVVKYGGPPDVPDVHEDDIGPVVKYGGPPPTDAG